MKHVPGRGAEQREVERIPAMDAEDDEIGLMGCRRAEYFSRCLALGQDHARVALGPGRERQKLLEPLACVALERAAELSDVEMRRQRRALACQVLERMYDYETAPAGTGSS